MPARDRDEVCPDVGAGSHAWPWEDVAWCICRGDGMPRPSVGVLHMFVVTDRMDEPRHVEAGSHACPGSRTHV
jgi:hypothetical protein